MIEERTVPWAEQRSPHTHSGSDPLTPAAAVRHELGRISNATLHRWIRSGKVPEPAAVVNGRRLWRWSTVLKAREHLIGGAK